MMGVNSMLQQNRIMIQTKPPPSSIRMCSPQLDAGDMVIFQASKGAEYDHGMKTVTRGKRVAIGLLQPK